jgi:hypothetical protein
LVPTVVAAAFEVRDTLFKLFYSDDGGTQLLPKKLNRILSTAGLRRKSAFQ